MRFCRVARLRVVEATLPGSSSASFKYTPPKTAVAMSSESAAAKADSSNDHLVFSDNPSHPANLIPSLCAKFWTLGWVTGTGGGCSIREE